MPSGRGRSLGYTATRFAALAVLTASPRPALADCIHTCDAKAKDAHGCCPAVPQQIIDAVGPAPPRTIVGIGVPLLQGDLDEAALRITLRGTVAKLLSCYEKQPPGLAGTVEVRFVIGPDGKVTKVTSAGVSRPLASCVAKVMEGLVFPRPRGDVQVTCPIAFDPPGSAAQPSDDDNIYGGLLGSSVGESYGRGGLDTGTSRSSTGTLGGHRDGSLGTGAGYGVRVGPSGGPTVALGQPSAKGQLDKAIIRRYLKRNLRKLSACYEQGLLALPKLAGTLEARFVITHEGKVAEATAIGVDPGVASCVADVIKAIEFPRPGGDGDVHVSYPVTLSPGPRPRRATR
jgi:hypothetical protein